MNKEYPAICSWYFQMLFLDRNFDISIKIIQILLLRFQLMMTKYWLTKWMILILLEVGLDHSKAVMGKFSNKYCSLDVCCILHYIYLYTVYPKKYAHGFVVLCFVVVMQSFIMNSHEVFIHIHQGCFAGTGGIVRLPQCQWSKPDGNGKISQCITTTKHSKAKSVAYFLGYTV